MRLHPTEYCYKLELLQIYLDGDFQKNRFSVSSEAKIKLKLKDGTKIKGYIIESNENGFVVMNSKTEQPTPVSYLQVS